MAKVVTPIHPYALAGVLDVAALAASCAALAALVTAIAVKVEPGEVLVLGGGAALIMVPGMAYWLYAGKRTAANRGYWFPLDAVTVRSIPGSSLAYFLCLAVISAVLIETISMTVDGTLDWSPVGAMLALSLPSARIASTLILEQLMKTRA